MSNVKCWHVVAFLLGLTLVLLGLPAFADDGTAAASVGATTGVVTSVGGVGVAGFLWLTLRKLDAYLDRHNRHCDVSERESKLQTKALERISEHLDRWAMRDEVRRENTGPISLGVPR